MSEIESANYKMLCEICGIRRATDKHHKFKKYKWRIRVYGGLMHDGKNLQNVCHQCHMNESEGLLVWSEYEFCEAIGIKPKSKVGMFRGILNE